METPGTKLYSKNIQLRTASVTIRSLIWNQEARLAPLIRSSPGGAVYGLLCMELDWHYPLLAHHDIWLHRKIRSLSGESGYGSTCHWLDPVVNAPERTS
jgi:hypothetical protein